MACYKNNLTIPNFSSRKQIEKFFMDFYALGKGVNFFYFLKCKADYVKDSELKRYYISCAQRYCNYASTGTCNSENPKVQKAHTERINRILLQEMRGISHKKRLRRELTDEDREKRYAYEKTQEVFKKYVKRRKSDKFIKIISIPMGGQNKKY